MGGGGGLEWVLLWKVPVVDAPFTPITSEVPGGIRGGGG